MARSTPIVSPWTCSRRDNSASRRAMSPVVKVFGCRPHDGGAAHTGAGVRKPPREETAGCRARCRVRRYGDLTAVVPECEYNFCDMARTLRMGENAPFATLVISKSYAL